MKTISPVFNEYSNYYDLLYHDKDYVSEVDYVDSLLSRYGMQGGSILELGSGTGKHGCIMATRGYSVHGIERSQEMVSRSQLDTGFSCQQGDICTIRTGSVYDAVLSLFHVMSYQVRNDNILAVFKTASEHLKSSGLFIFDFWYSPAVYSSQPEVRIKRVENDEVEIIRIAEPFTLFNENRVDVHYTILARNLNSNMLQKTTEVHSMRHFSLPEIDLLAEISGFDRIGAEEFLSGKSIGPDTWGACIILKKK